MAKKREDYNQLSIDQLKNALVDEKQKFSRLKFNHAVSPLADPIEIRKVRRNIARISTAITLKNNQEDGEK